MVHALELLEVELPVLSVLQIVQGELDVRGHLVACVITSRDLAEMRAKSEMRPLTASSDGVESHRRRIISKGRRERAVHRVHK